MNIKEILKHVDHTLLLQGSTWEEIKQICDDAMKYETASVCIAPSYVKEAAEYMNGRIPVCTVIWFSEWLHDNCSKRIRDQRCPGKRRF